MKTDFYEIEPYQIQVTAKSLTVALMEDGVYQVCEGKEPVAALYPEIAVGGVYWNGFGQISAALAKEIGAACRGCRSLCR